MASMRPQRNAAENVRSRIMRPMSEDPASMRPQRNAAENDGLYRVLVHGRQELQ